MDLPTDPIPNDCRADGLGPILVLSPHPDDEILGAGAIMARSAAAGDAVGVVVLTDGHRSDPGSDPAALVARRRTELVEGLAAMMPPPPILFLDHPDGALADAAIDIGAETPLGRFVAAVSPHTVLAPDPADGHPDHKAAFGLAVRLAVAGRAARIEVMPISQRVDGLFDADDADGYRALPVGALAGAKARGIAAHASQIDPVDGFALGPEVRDAFARTEYLRTAHDGGDAAVPAGHFDALFGGSDDPWDYDRSAYERDRFARTVAMLEDRRYGDALELGCANGALAEALLPLCDRLVACDASAAALDVARRRLAGRPVRFVAGALPEACPEGPFDLILASDMLYYLGIDGVAALAARLDAAARPGARILLANWLGPTDAQLSGEMAAEAAIACLPGWRRVRAERTDRLRLDLMERR